MEIQLVSHASVVITCGQTGIWTDPWLVSKAFNNSWALLPKPDHVDVPYDKIQYIWISHEHPDHFNVPTLKALPEDFKRSVVVLFQKTNSNKIFEALHDYGFRHFIALENKTLVELEPGLEVYCYQNHIIDSCLGVRHNNQVIFNVNDAELDKKDCQQILNDLGHVDVCLNQFSLAGYRGYADRQKYLPRIAEEKMQRILNNHQDLHAACTMPFASFVYFCCADNQYLNQYINKPAAVYERFEKRGFPCSLLYPGDVWDIDLPFDSTNNVAKFRMLFDNLGKLPIDEPPVIAEKEIMAEFGKMTKTLHEHYPKFLLKTIPAFTAYVEDLGRSFVFDVANGHCQGLILSGEECDLRVYSQPLHFTFKFPFGAETLTVSARVLVQHNFGNWQRFKRLCVLNAAEIYLHPKYLLQSRNFLYIRDRLKSSMLSQLMSRVRRQRKIAATTG